MINVNELKRNAKNIVKKYSDAQVKVREATSNDPWGPSSTIMADIADLTYNVVAFSEIMQMIWKRLNDHGKNWRHVFKSLVLLEYLIKTGNEKVSQQCIENIFAIQTLKDFQYIEEGKDNGSSIREKSKKLVALLKDPERLKSERARALKAKSRAVEAVSSNGKSNFVSMMGRSSSGSGDTTKNSNSSSDNAINPRGGIHAGSSEDSSAVMATDIDSARPHSLTEEETQLQIALALSKEEAERQEKTRKNDELRLKLALNASKHVASGSSSDLVDDFPGPSVSMAGTSNANLPQLDQTRQQTTGKSSKQSNIDDLLGLSFTSPADHMTTDFLDSAQSKSQPSPFVSSITTGLEPQNDPWSNDPWQPSPITLQSTTQSIINPSSGLMASTTTALPKPASTVPNPFPSTTDNIFGANPRKPFSKNPFED